MLSMALHLDVQPSVLRCALACFVEPEAHCAASQVWQLDS